MAIANLHKVDKIVVGGSFTFHEIENFRLDSAIVSLIRRPSGHVSPMFRAGLSQQQVITFTTSEIDTAWANIPHYGVYVSADTDLYEKLATATGSDARANTTHIRYRVSDCFVFWTRTSLQHNGVGTIDVTIMPVYDGSNNPIVPAGSTALSGTLAATNHFVAGPVAWNGTTLNGIQSIEISTGLQTLLAGGEGEVWNTFVGTETIEPIVTLGFFDATSLTGMTILGTALNGSTGLTLYGRHVTGTSRSANGTSAHIKLVGANGAILPSDISGQGSSPTSHTARVELIAASDSTFPMTLSTATTIS